jgi:hypothetical protein
MSRQEEIIQMRMRGITKRVEGQILVIVISISAIIALLLSGVSILLGSAFGQSFYTANISLDQNQATSAVNYLTAELNNAQQGNGSPLSLTSLGFASSQNSVALPAATYGANAYEQDFEQNEWQAFDSTGESIPCPTTGKSYSIGPCYFIKAKAYYASNVSSAYNSAASLQSITAEIVEGRNCLDSTASNAVFGKSCQSISYYSGDIETNNYYNYLYFTNYETLAPKFYPSVTGVSDPNIVNGKDLCQTDNTAPNCVPVAYESDYVASPGGPSYGDTLNGAIRTNSKEIYTCVGASSAFNVPSIEATSTTPLKNECNPIPVSTTQTTVSPISFPSSVSSLAQIAYPYWFPTGTSIELSNTYIQAVFNIPDSNYATFFQNVLSPQILQDGGTASISSGVGNVSIPISSTNGVIYSTGSISNLVGELQGQLTVAANGDISIASTPAANGIGANLYYNCAFQSPTPTAIPSGCPDMLGVVAQGDISIGSTPTTATTPSITVDGALTALGTATGSASSGDGTIYAAAWDFTSPNKACITTLSSSVSQTGNNYININGSLVSQYRGVFGEYNQSSQASLPSSSPCLISGYYKNFNWDARLGHQQPPYSFSPSSATFTPLGVRHVFGLS